LTDSRFLFSHAGETIPMLAVACQRAQGPRKDIAEIAPDGI